MHAVQGSIHNHLPTTYRSGSKVTPCQLALLVSAPYQRFTPLLYFCYLRSTYIYPISRLGCGGKPPPRHPIMANSFPHPQGGGQREEGGKEGKRKNSSLGSVDRIIAPRLPIPKRTLDKPGGPGVTRLGDWPRFSNPPTWVRGPCGPRSRIERRAGFRGRQILQLVIGATVLYSTCEKHD